MFQSRDAVGLYEWVVIHVRAAFSRLAKLKLRVKSAMAFYVSGVVSWTPLGLWWDLLSIAGPNPRAARRRNPRVGQIPQRSETTHQSGGGALGSDCVYVVGEEAPLPCCWGDTSVPGGGQGACVQI